MAGAREMMRYRRNRATTLEGAAQQPQTSNVAPMPSNGYGAAAGSTPWAVYQGGAKPVSGQVPMQSANMNSASAAQAAQQAAMRKVRQIVACLYINSELSDAIFGVVVMILH